MDTFLLIISFIVGVSCGVVLVTGISLVLDRRRESRKRKPIVQTPRTFNGPVEKPPTSVYSDYTLAELKSHANYLIGEIKRHVNYPYSRADSASKLKMVSAEIDYREYSNGTYEFDKQRESRQKELEAFDREMNRIGKTNDFL